MRSCAGAAPARKDHGESRASGTIRSTPNSESRFGKRLAHPGSRSDHRSHSPEVRLAAVIWFVSGASVFRSTWWKSAIGLPRRSVWFCLKLRRVRHPKAAVYVHRDNGMPIMWGLDAGNVLIRKRAFSLSPTLHRPDRKKPAWLVCEIDGAGVIP